MVTCYKRVVYLNSRRDQGSVCQANRCGSLCAAFDLRHTDDANGLNHAMLLRWTGPRDEEDREGERECKKCEPNEQRATSGYRVAEWISWHEV